MRLIQIPFSHNCIKVRRALELKGLAYETLDIDPMDREPVRKASGQDLVPALEDDGRCIAESTAILRHLEQAYPSPSLLPSDPAKNGECWLIEDWSDRSLMALTRRLAYWYRLNETPEKIAERFFPEAGSLKRWMMMRVAHRALVKRFGLSEQRNARDEKELPRVAGIALERLAGSSHFFDGRTTVADVAVATNFAPVLATVGPLRSDPAVTALSEWSRPILGDEVLRLYEADG